MCGIFGFLTEQPNQVNFNLFRKTMWASQSRGKDATGIGIVEKNKVTIHKKPIPANEYIAEKLDDFKESISKANIVIGHVRSATMGKPENNNNNHPIQSERWIMIHNGTLHNLKRIDGYKYKGEVDSEILLSYIETEGLEPGLENAGGGSAAIAMLDKQHLDCIYLFEHSGNIAVAYDDASKTIFFASTKSILEEALKNKMIFFSTFQFETLPSDTLFKISLPLDITVIKKITQKKVFYHSTSEGYDYEGYGNYSGWNRNVSQYHSSGGVSKISKGKSKNKPTKEAELTSRDWGYIWDMKEKEWILGSVAEKYLGALPNYDNLAFPMGRQSADFFGWKKVEGGKGYISSDGTLFKVFNRDTKEHMIMGVEDAIHMGILQNLEGKVSAVLGMCTLDCFLDETNEVVGFRIWNIAEVDVKGVIPAKPCSKYLTARRTIEVSGVECLLVCEKMGYTSRVVYFEVLDATDLVNVIDDFVGNETKSRLGQLMLECKEFESVMGDKVKFLGCTYCRKGLRNECKMKEAQESNSAQD